ncbi:MULTISPECIES: hypothetical protein [unclassified Variovorax]
MEEAVSISALARHRPTSHEDEDDDRYLPCRPKAPAVALPALCFADIDAAQYIGIEIEAFPLTSFASSGADNGEWLEIPNSAGVRTVPMYLVLLRNRSGVAERIADFATCVEAVDYAESIIALQLNRGFHWTRSGRIFDIYCVTGRLGDSLFLGKESMPGMPRWVRNPADAMQFNCGIEEEKMPKSFLPDGQFDKRSWLAAKVLFERARKAEVASSTTVIIKTEPKHRFAPSFAQVQVDEELCVEIMRLQRLCIDRELGEVRLDIAPLRWGPDDARTDLALFRDQLIVTQTAFQFAVQSGALCGRVKTCAQNIVAFIRSVDTHRPEQGVLLMEEEDDRVTSANDNSEDVT